MIVPGAPGEIARVMPGAEAAERFGPDPTSPGDVAFVAAMVPHHRQALEMASLAPDRAADTGVTAMAERIAAAQGPEIAVMEAWLARQDPDLAGGHGGAHGGAGHGADGTPHPGMATPEQMAELAGATGPAFDRLFLQLMIAHHEGALRMAEQAVVGGTDLTALQMADHVVATQSAEIDRMRGLLGAA